MLQRQSKNNDLVIQVEGAGIRKLEYYTDGEYKYVTDYVRYMIDKYYFGNKEAKKAEKNCVEKMFKVVLRYDDK